jgi:hypothetical protein
MYHAYAVIHDYMENPFQKGDIQINVYYFMVGVQCRKIFGLETGGVHLRSSNKPSVCLFRPGESFNGSRSLQDCQIML